MCDLMLAFGIGSTLLGGASQISQAGAQAQAGNYNAHIAEMNATLADRRAKDALERGRLEEQKKRQEVSQIMGQQTAAFAANGLDVTFGSPLDAIIDTAVMGEIDALTIRRNAYREDQDFRQQGLNFRTQAGMERASAKAAKKNGWLSAGATVLGGYGDIYKNQYKMSQYTKASNGGTGLYGQS